MRKHQISLTEEEAELLSSIELDQAKINHVIYIKNSPIILKLLSLLIKREAIPSIRLQYWEDPNFNIGRIKSSHKGLFERNGTTGKDIYTHPNFLPYLCYFIYGAQLQHTTIADFEKAVGRPEWVSSSDVQKITKHVRASVRRLGGMSELAEEFYKLSLDVGLSLSIAKAVLRAAKEVR
jgi:hypothetical protein